MVGVWNVLPAVMVEADMIMMLTRLFDWHMNILGIEGDAGRGD